MAKKSASSQNLFPPKFLQGLVIGVVLAIALICIYENNFSQALGY